MNFEKAFSWDDAAKKWFVPIVERRDSQCTFVMLELKASRK
jgi:hypothetical protein